MNETAIFKNIQLKLCSMGVRLWRNNCGRLQDRNGTWVQYGIANPGGADGIGFVKMEIKPEHVGKKIAVFLAIEVKTEIGKPTNEQKNFLNYVRESGGIAFIARSVNEAVEKITIDKT